MQQPVNMDISVLSMNISLYGQEESGHELVTLESMSDPLYTMYIFIEIKKKLKKIDFWCTMHNCTLLINKITLSYYRCYRILELIFV